MSYRQLPMKRADLHDLRLDLTNYRIPTPQPNEVAAMRYLLAEEDVLGLGKLILRDGYFDNEVPIVTDVDGDLIVLEGNRRVAALKVLNEPELVPDWTDVVNALLRRYAMEATNLPESIRVLVASSRLEADRHIARLHTTAPKRRWSRDQQATFYHSLLEDGQSVQAIKMNYPGVDVVRFIKMAEMRRMLGGVQFEDPALKAHAVSPRLKMSVFEYAYRNPGVLTALGVSFDEEGRLNPPGHSAEQVGAGLPPQGRRAVERLIRKFRDDKLDTRSAEFKKDTQANSDLVAALLGSSTPPAPAPPAPIDSGGEPGPASSSTPASGQGDAEDHRPHGSSTSDDAADSPAADEAGSDGGGGGAEGRPAPGPVPSASNTGDGSGASAAEPPDEQDTPADQGASATGPRGPNRPQTRPRLNLAGLDYRTHVSTNLEHRYHELRRLNLDETPAAAAVMLRSVLESSIKFHFESTSTPASGPLSASVQAGRQHLRVRPGAAGSDQQDPVRDGQPARQHSVVQRDRPFGRRRGDRRGRARGVSAGRASIATVAASGVSTFTEWSRDGR